MALWILVVAICITLSEFMIYIADDTFNPKSINFAPDLWFRLLIYAACFAAGYFLSRNGQLWYFITVLILFLTPIIEIDNPEYADAQSGSKIYLLGAFPIHAQFFSYKDGDAITSNIFILNTWANIFNRI
jgi:hypothetical protein